MVSPHIHGGRSTSKIMLDVLISLLPATIAGTVIFGLNALLVVLVCVCSAVISEFLFNLAVKKEQTIDDLSAVVTGLLL
ncbi:MAG: RnfABCDGE type electron transport complex subunit D, partial [Clostridia bacterium]|nr:RnfABCDGE type electron transport complex subunit D [Clostridia bacterium]